MELEFVEERRITGPFLYFNQHRLPTLTDVAFLDETHLILAHRSAGKFYLLEVNLDKEAFAILNSVEVDQPPDLFAIQDSVIYCTNFTNTITKIPIVNGKFGTVEYIPIHETNIYHGATTKDGNLYFTQTLEQYFQIQTPFCITMLDTKTNTITHRYPEHNCARIKKVEFIGDLYMLLLVTKNFYNYANSTPENPILMTDSEFVLVDFTSWKTLDSFPIRYSHADSIAIQENEFFITTHSSFEGGLLLRGKVENGKFTNLQKMSCLGFPHGITVRNTHLLYTSYQNSSLVVHKLDETHWNTLDVGKWTLSTYITPQNKDMVILLPYFNPCKSTRLFQNALTIRELLKRAQIPYCIGEVAFGNEPFSFSPAENVYQFRSKSYGFYKETIANLLISRLQTTYSKFMLLDADVVFSNADWYTKVSEYLNCNDVVHPFDKMVYLGFDFQPRNSLQSIVINPNEHSSSGHAWAFHLDWWRKANGLFEYALIGGGDVAFCMQVGISTEQFITMNLFQDPIHVENTKLEYIHQIAFHLPHGNSGNRQYHTRKLKIKQFLEKRNIEYIETIVEKNSDGLLECKKEFLEDWNTVVYEYFSERNDDGL